MPSLQYRKSKKVTFRLCHCEMKGARRLKKLFEKDGRAGPKKCRSPHATLTANMMSHGHRNAEPIVHVEQLCEQLVSSRMPFLLLENAITNMNANSQIRKLFEKDGRAEPLHFSCTRLAAGIMCSKGNRSTWYSLLVQD